MVYKNKKTMMIVLFIMIGILLWVTYKLKAIEYRVFGTIGVIWASIQYVFTLFEYYKIDNNHITHVYRLGLKQDEVHWKDITRVYIVSERFFKAVKIDYGTFSGSSMVINSGIRGYKELVKTILVRTKDNRNISLDLRLDVFLTT
jgi:hypothetical protein